MKLDHDSCYHALKTHDVRFDGRFFVGVSSTGIYCRPVCTAKLPRRENCAFFPSAAAAEQAGYRPCLRCRPELAPGHASVDAMSRLARAAAGHWEDGLLGEVGVGEAAARLGVSDRHLRRVFHGEYGVTPIAFVQTQRLLLAKRLLTDTRLTITEVAFASGFTSLRRFNALFKARYRMNPSDLRQSRASLPGDPVLYFELAYRPPLAWRALLDFLGRRAVAGVEAVSDGVYRRVVNVSGTPAEQGGWIAVSHRPERATLRVGLSAGLAQAVPWVLARVKRLFDLSCDPTDIAARLGPLAAADPGLRVPGAFDGFEVAVRAILGQQITVAAAITLAGRFAARFGDPRLTPYPALTHAFPQAGRIVAAGEDEIAGLGIVRTRARAIRAVAQALVDDAVTLEPGVDVTATLERLRALPGIGDWTAQYIAMRALAWPDAFPASDVGVRKALGGISARAAERAAAPWQPWRSYAVMHLWRSLEQQP
ncbi:MAG: helix-turn-helix domain-containing protein [Gammaproteobacteria bacterium]|nr:helix-turn-helix domain-containing protein [Gammaproteobacteria bacterium]MCP5423562.1 helix-turn-helix domain-containing protein [Gammaproteobacteria bacterium]